MIIFSFPQNCDSHVENIVFCGISMEGTFLNMSERHDLNHISNKGPKSISYLPSPRIPLAPLANAKSLNFSMGSLALAKSRAALAFMSASALAPEVCGLLLILVIKGFPKWMWSDLGNRNADSSRNSIDLHNPAWIQIDWLDKATFAVFMYYFIESSSHMRDFQGALCTHVLGV